MVKCTRCGKDKPRSEFYPNKATANKLQAYCKKCNNVQHREYMNQPPMEDRFNHGKPWTTKEIQYIKDFMDTDSPLELAYALGRSVGVIHNVKRELRRNNNDKDN